MKAVLSRCEAVALVFILMLYFNASYRLTGLQVCSRCDGTVQNNTYVRNFCCSSAGRLDKRCCLANNSSDPERIIGLDLSSCSLTQVEDLSEASRVVVIDLSLNPITNISDEIFQGFLDLNFLILPGNIACPGGSASWEQMEVKQGKQLCKDQKNMCNQTGQMSVSCPENSLCSPNGPGFFECRCDENSYGYKCLRQLEFPALKVFVPVAASSVVISFLLWFTQRRKAKSPRV